MNKPLKGFIAYSHKDTEQKDELRTRLAVMKEQKKLVTWHDGDITAGGQSTSRRYSQRGCRFGHSTLSRLC